MIYPPSWIFQRENHNCRRTLVVSFNPLLRGFVGSYLLKRISVEFERNSTTGLRNHDVKKRIKNLIKSENKKNIAFIYTKILWSYIYIYIYIYIYNSSKDSRNRVKSG